MNGKSKRITDIVDYLQTQYGVNNILIKDHWEGLENAIGLTDKNGRYLVYISTIGDNENEFYLELEDPPTDDSFPYSPAGNFDQIDLSKLEELVAKHLKLGGG